MDNELKRILLEITNAGALVNGAPTSKTFVNTTDSLEAISNNVGNPSGDTLTSLTAKWGNIARSLDIILGARWDASGDLGTDVAAIIADVGDPSARTNFQSLETMIGIPDAANSNLDDILRTGFDSTSISSNADGSILERLEELRNLIEIAGGAPLPAFTEFWETETIEADVWTITSPATGTLAIDATEAGYVKVGISPNANEVGRLVSDQRWRVIPDIAGTNNIARRLNLEFEAKFTNVANMDNTLCIFGFSDSAAATRATNNLAAFALSGDALIALTDDATTENTGAIASTLTNWNKFRIEIYSGNIRFYVNETAGQTFTSNLPDQLMYVNFYVDTEGTGAATFDLGHLRIWYSDVA